MSARIITGFAQDPDQSEIEWVSDHVIASGQLYALTRQVQGTLWERLATVNVRPLRTERIVWAYELARTNGGSAPYILSTQEVARRATARASRISNI